MTMENGAQKEEVITNLAEHLKTKGYPPIWTDGPQEQKTRDFIAQMKRAMELGKPLSPEDIEYFGIYKRITGRVEETFEYSVKYSRKELEEKERNPGFTDFRNQLMDVVGKVLQETTRSLNTVSERAIKEIRENSNAAMKASQDAAKTARESLETMGKYYVDMVDKVTKSSENNAKYMTETLKTLNIIIGDLLKAFGVHVQTYDELSKKKLKELVKMFDEKSLDDPDKSKDFMDKFMEFVPVVKAGIEASGREVPASIKAALDKFAEIQNKQG